MVNKAFREYLDKFMKLFLDDFSIYSDMDSHLEKLELVFEKCLEYGISINPEKSAFMVTSGSLLGHIVCEVGEFPDPIKIAAIVNMPRPTSLVEVQRFMGVAQFLRIYIKDLAKITAPITRLTRKSDTFVWTDECEAAMELIKEKYTNAPILISREYVKLMKLSSKNLSNR